MDLIFGHSQIWSAGEPRECVGTGCDVGGTMDNYVMWTNGCGELGYEWRSRSI